MKSRIVVFITGAFVSNNCWGEWQTYFKKYKKNKSVLDYKEFPGRDHFVLGQKTWKEDADYIPPGSPPLNTIIYVFWGILSSYLRIEVFAFSSIKFIIFFGLSVASIKGI